MKKKRNLTTIVVIFLIVIGGLLRLYKLNWGEYYFHPDEHNILYGLEQIRFPFEWNPNFFVYGAFPVYVMYFIGILVSFVSTGSIQLSFIPQDSVVLARSISALASIVSIPMICVLSQKLFRQKSAALLNTFLTTFMVGYVQYAHFATFESIQILLYLTIVFVSLLVIEHPSKRNYLLLGVAVGCTIGTKTTNMFLLLIPFLCTLINQIKESSTNQTIWGQVFTTNMLAILKHRLTLFSVGIIGLTFVVTNPYVILNFPGFVRSLTFESNVATGVLDVFYTRGFTHTTPVLYQFTRVLPFVSGYLFLAISLFGTLLLLKKIMTTRSQEDYRWLPFLAVFGIYLILNFSLYVKWTRYMVVALPFFSTAAVFGIYWLDEKLQTPKLSWIAKIISVVICFEIALRGISFFTIYLQTDTRYLARSWIDQNVSENEMILVEDKDPNHLVFKTIPEAKLLVFNINNLDKTEEAPEELSGALVQSDYLAITSNRIYSSARRNPNVFPVTNRYYNALFDGSLGFEKISEFSSRVCLQYPLLQNRFICTINEAEAEETFTSFDHPQIMIYQKINPLDQKQYQKILLNEAINS